MTFIILFEDAPDADPDIRKIHMADHLDFLERHADRIEAAGPLADPSGSGRDGLWIVNTTNIEEADRLVHEDPFWPTGLRKSYAIIHWTQVFAAGKRLLKPT